MSRHLLPDVLIQYPVGSLVVWKQAHFGSKRKKHDRLKYYFENEPRYSNVLGRVLGKNQHQGNGRLSIEVLYTMRNPFSEMCLWRRRMTSVGVDHIVDIHTYMAMRGTRQ